MSAGSSMDSGVRFRSVFPFGGSQAIAEHDVNLLGGKGAGLAEMSKLGIPIPPGFTIGTETCAYYFSNQTTLPSHLAGEVEEGLRHIENVVGSVFGDLDRPLLLSVRSGSRVSMPGMMDTVLNLGLNDKTVEGLTVLSGSARFAWDCYRRFIQMYANVVLGFQGKEFEHEIAKRKQERAVILDSELEATDWRALVSIYKKMVIERTGIPFPEAVNDQLWGAIEAVLRSWNSDRAITYRRLNNIPEQWGTAVTVQAMVFGNMGDTSATGVAFTRNPATGQAATYGEFLIDAQGEDVVAGIRTPQYISESERVAARSEMMSLESAMPGAFADLVALLARLEDHYRDMQDVEFTIQDGKLWILQTRSGKRTVAAALKIAVDMALEGRISRSEAIARVDPEALGQLLHPAIDPSVERKVLAKGLPASPGAACGAIAFDAETAVRRSAAGGSIILVRTETSPDDIHGMHASKGILTSRGGMTSHAAVVARGMGRPCICGAARIVIDLETRTMRVGTQVFNEFEIVTIDGATGEVMHGRLPTVQPDVAGGFGLLLEWADSERRMRVRANAETPADCRTAVAFGAEGIGLCRTEHMFFDPSRINIMREMIIAADDRGRQAALAKLLPEQRTDFS